MKRYAPFIIAALVFAGIAGASSIKVWVAGETLSVADLNSNFAHIHNLMVGGHGGRLVNADVSASAAISHSKLASPALLPKAFASQEVVCDGGTCTPAVVSRITTITRTGTGVYTVNISPSLTNTDYAVFVTPSLCAAASNVCFCRSNTRNINGVEIVCYDKAGAVTDAAFSISIMDNND